MLVIQAIQKLIEDFEFSKKDIRSSAFTKRFPLQNLHSIHELVKSNRATSTSSNVYTDRIHE